MTTDALNAAIDETLADFIVKRVRAELKNTELTCDLDTPMGIRDRATRYL